jgi:glycosyltransferase involved in cell wall biosynthesis
LKVLIAPAHVLLSSRTGTEPTWAYNIVARLAKHFSVQVNAVCGKADDLTLPSCVRVFEVGFERGDLTNRALFYFRCYGVAKRLCGSADVVHHMFPFGFRAGFNPLAIFGRLKDKSFVIGPIQYPQECSDITDYEWVSGRSGLKAWLMYDLEHTIMRFIQKPIEMLHEATLSEAGALVFDSRKTLELYRRLYSDILRGKTLEVIPPGVETKQFQYVPPIKRDYFEILTVGYLLKRKGIQYLISAMPFILREVKNVKLRIVGDGPYKAELARLTKRLSLEDHVIFQGRITREETIKYYHLSDVFVLPALSTTVSVFLEAQACGRPVIGTTAGYIPELIADGRTGFIIAKGCVEELKEKIVRLLSDEELRLKMGINARKWVEENFDWDKLIKQWYNLYKSLI